MDLQLTVGTAIFLGILILSGLFCAYLINAIRAADEATAHTKRNNACASFVGLVLLILLYLG